MTLSQPWNVLEISMLISLGLVTVATLLFYVAFSLKNRNLRDGQLILARRRASS